MGVAKIVYHGYGFVLRLREHVMNWIRLSTLGCLCGLAFVTAALAQGGKAVPVSQLAVDVVGLKTGKAIRGAIVKAGADGTLTVAVSREWLRTSNPDLYQKAVAKESETRKHALEQLCDRLKQKLETPPTEARLVFFLKQELERAQMQLAADKPDLPQFLWLELEQDAVARVVRASEDRHRVAMWAWSEQVPHVESRDVADLQRELKQRMIEVTAAPPDLSDRLGARLQDDREWAARMAIVEYSFGKPLDFQGTGDVLVRADPDRKVADLAPVLSKVLKSQVDSLLKDLLGDGRPAATNDSDWLKSATSEADDSSMSGLRATRVEVKPEGGKATVQTVFAARMPGGKWEIAWSHRESQDATKPRPDIEARINSDPQVKKILETTKSLGADDTVRQAIRFGAATMVAQEAANARFFEFRDRYTKHLDGPPLIWEK